jgi:hypothetical protein
MRSDLSFHPSGYLVTAILTPPRRLETCPSGKGQFVNRHGPARRGRLPDDEANEKEEDETGALTKQRFFGVEPRGFERLTSAVQERVLNVVVVRPCSKTPANKHIISSNTSGMVAVVRLGRCQIGADWRQPCPYLNVAIYRPMFPRSLQKNEESTSRLLPERGRRLNRSRTTRTRAYYARLPSDPRSSRRWADPTRLSGRAGGKASKLRRSPVPDRIPSRAPNSPRPTP